MPNFHFTFLSAKDLPRVRETFLKAFADYVVPMQLTEEQLKDKVVREGIEPGFSVGAFVGEELVGFILTGLGEWQGKPTAYNGGTGVIPQYRGYGLTQQMYTLLLAKLRECGIEQCLLEVIQGNDRAIRAYEKIGFHATRSLSFYRATKQELLLEGEPPERITIHEASQPDFKTCGCFRDAEPSWQNDAQALKRSKSLAQTLEARNEHQDVVGCISFFRKNGAVAQLAVDKHWRNKGIGLLLLREAVQRIEAPAVLFINVEDTAHSMISFLQGRHFNLFLKQYEMLMPTSEV